MVGDSAVERQPGGWARAIAAIIGVSGAVLLAGGGKLVTLGGSPHYAITGVALLVVAVLLWRGSRLARLVMLLVLLDSWVWALWEAGLDGWALLPRVGWVSGLALLFLIPGVARFTGSTDGGKRAGRALAAILVAVVVAFVGIMIWQPGVPRGNAAVAQAGGGATEWLNWGNDPGGTRHAPAVQLTPATVGGLEVAWRYETGAAAHPGGAPALAFEVTPLKIGNTLYGCTPHNVVFALDATTGREIWRYDPKVNERGLGFANCRGMAYADLTVAGRVAGKAPVAATPCAERLYMGTVDARMLAIDARDGKLCKGFGDAGIIDLRLNMGPHPTMYYYVTSPPVVSGNVVVTGSYGLDGQTIRQPSGVIKAFDLVTGARAWDFDPADPARTAAMGPDEIYEPGTPNSWSVASTDEELGLVYFPMGVATPDYYGGERSAAAEKYSNAIIALDNRTGAVRWIFQTVHHDIWDYDIASQPVLADFPVGGRMVPALISISKTGDVFVLDRATGKPLSRVIEKKVPGDPGPGEKAFAPTQPFSVDMPDFAGERLKERDMWGLTLFDQMWCRIAFRELRYEGRYTPPSLKGSLQYPGFTGGVNWGSFSVDPGNRLLVVNSNRLPTKSTLILPADAAKRGMAPAGGGRAFSPEAVRAGVPQYGSRFAVLNGVLMSPLSVPCIEPPIGEISAIDLRTRKLAWRRPLGTADRMGPLGIASRLPVAFGLPTVGGTITTAGGVTFIASTPDKRIHAFATKTGRPLWRADLPANGNANPMSYIGDDGRQFVVIAAGGSGALATNEKNVLVAFALPKKAVAR